jgi:aminoglycoside phosphotransferase (APT) family kinase protein
MTRTLGARQAALHALDATAFAEALRAEGLTLDTIDGDRAAISRKLDQIQADWLNPGFRWLDEHAPPPPSRVAICHGDFHPLNIMMQGRDVTGVIDWGWVRIADPTYDVGASVALFTQGPVNLPGFLQPLIGFVRRRLVGGYLNSYGSLMPLDRASVRYFEAQRLLGFLSELAAEAALAQGVGATSSAFAHPRVQRSILTRFRQITGGTLTLPDAVARATPPSNND